MNRIVDRLLAVLVTHGSLEVVRPGGLTRQFGDGSGETIRIRITTPATEWAILAHPELALGEAFTDGRLIVEQGTVYDLLMLLLGNGGRDGSSKLHRMRRRLRTATRVLRQQNRIGVARRNVQHHYDIGNDLYRLFLDDDLQYSCAWFERGDETLEEAQLAKKRHIAAKLALSPGQRVLDIGCGWGGMGLYLAGVADSDVLGVTLSNEQQALATERAAAAGLSGSARFALRDYRTVEDRFDRIVSVGMFEHVGIAHYPEFFEKCRELLADDGVILVHTIGRTGPRGATNPWIQKYIFPGGYIPSLSEIMDAIEPTGLIVSDVEILRLHYAETLRHWRERFMARREEAVALMDERFCRMWEFYLAGSETGFRLGDFVNFQIQIVKDVSALPLTRGYMADAEDGLGERERAGKRPVQAAAAAE